MKLYTAFSGGADSTALALIEPDAIPLFVDTGCRFRLSGAWTDARIPIVHPRMYLEMPI